MLPKIHIIYGLIFSAVLFLIFPEIGIINATIVFLASFLIDVDHYLYFVYKEKSWNLKKSIDWYFFNKHKFEKMSSRQKREIYTGLCFLHGIEAFVLLVIFILIFKNLQMIFISIMLGFLFHQILDAIDLYRRDYRFDKVISFSYAVFNTRDKKLLQEL